MDTFPIPLAGLSLTEIEEQLAVHPRFRASQIYKWIACGVNNFDDMKNIPGTLREELKNRFTLYTGKTAVCNDAGGHLNGGAKKVVIELKDGIKIEAVLLSDGKERLTACLSTQAGCPAACVFCKTGSMGFRRNLDCAEIVEQFLFLRQIAREQASGASKDSNAGEHIIDNIVIMGMGEPLLNLANLRKAIAIITDKAGINFSKRRITISTCGICEALLDIANNGPYVRLALSLTTADELLRSKLMPLTAANPLAKVKEAIASFQKNSGLRITLELVLLGGINTRDIDALSIANFAKGIDTVINIIPWNPVAGLAFEGSPLREPDSDEVDNFVKQLEGYGLKVTIRRHKGRGVNGACGQLGSI